MKLSLPITSLVHNETTRGELIQSLQTDMLYNQRLGNYVSAGIISIIIGHLEEE